MEHTYKNHLGCMQRLKFHWLIHSVQHSDYKVITNLKHYNIYRSSLIYFSNYSLMTTLLQHPKLFIGLRYCMTSFWTFWIYPSRITDQIIIKRNKKEVSFFVFWQFFLLLMVSTHTKPNWCYRLFWSLFCPLLYFFLTIYLKDLYL